MNGKLGIDIGRVIMAPVVGGKADTSFLSGTLERAMNTPPSPHAFESVRELVDAFDQNVWLVSKCGPTVQNKTLHWLRHWNFFEETGVMAGRVRFCLKRHEKADHCRELAITHFIDDRVDVLRHLRDDVDHLFLFGEQPDEQEEPAWATPVLDWPAALEVILE